MRKIDVDHAIHGVAQSGRNKNVYQKVLVEGVRMK